MTAEDVASARARLMLHLAQVVGDVASLSASTDDVDKQTERMIEMADVMMREFGLTPLSMRRIREDVDVRKREIAGLAVPCIRKDIDVRQISEFRLEDETDVVRSLASLCEWGDFARFCSGEAQFDRWREEMRTEALKMVSITRLSLIREMLDPFEQLGLDNLIARAERAYTRLQLAQSHLNTMYQEYKSRLV